MVTEKTPAAKHLKATRVIVSLFMMPSTTTAPASVFYKKSRLNCNILFTALAG